MLRFGTISEVDANKGLARVKFPEDGIVSGWLPVLQKNTLKNKHSHTYDVDEHVACLMDGNAENGVIMGAVYSKNELPGAVKGANIEGVQFDDGTKIKYDRSAKVLTVDCAGDVTVICKNATIQADTKVEIECADIQLKGDVTVTGNLTASGDMEATGDIKTTTGDISTSTGDVSAGVIKLKLHKHAGVTPGAGITATPVP